MSNKGGAIISPKKLISALALVTVVVIGALTYTDEDARMYFAPLTDPEVKQVVQMVDNAQKGVPASVKIPFAVAVVAHGSRYKIPYKSLVQIAYVESKFKPDATNKTGDRGIMQPNRKYCRPFYERESDLWNVYKNVETACRKIDYDRRSGHKDLASYHSWDPNAKAHYRRLLADAERRIKNG